MAGPPNINSTETLARSAEFWDFHIGKGCWSCINPWWIAHSISEPKNDNSNADNSATKYASDAKYNSTAKYSSSVEYDNTNK